MAVFSFFSTDSTIWHCVNCATFFSFSVTVNLPNWVTVNAPNDCTLPVLHSVGLSGSDAHRKGCVSEERTEKNLGQEKREREKMFLRRLTRFTGVRWIHQRFNAFIYHFYEKSSNLIFFRKIWLYWLLGYSRPKIVMLSIGSYATMKWFFSAFSKIKQSLAQIQKLK